ncbi:Fic/DOC family protein [Peloplasma aerotolerans]|uniref:protein adenylyltransferase n=1 Tax=Peloplasma aerotolerans TaxID=3044389 RepID=A0AAW6UC18_9MOLU|nr:Fic family protein [Mariniplasma sp. M4Ah]MDI6453693.1 Fic family protein [Mariniplasma sp. M4Ah]
MSDPYLYENSHVLRNILDIRNEENLEAYENTVVNLALLKMFKENYNVSHADAIFDIHKHIFSDVYDWAGKSRTINIEKSELILNGLSVKYEDKSKVMTAIHEIHLLYFDKPWKTMSKNSFIYEMTRYIASLWKIHPFREGNTRTLSTYLYFFLENHNYTLDEKLLNVHAAYIRNALVMASLDEYSEYQYLEDILSDAIIHKTNRRPAKNRTVHKYEKIKDIEMKNYKYNYHQHKKE